jgi:hypothetical protein
VTGIEAEVFDTAVHEYTVGTNARVFGKPRDANPHPEGTAAHAFWLDGWSHFDEVNGGGPRSGADYSKFPWFRIPEFQHFFVVPIVEENGKPTIGEWVPFISGRVAARAARAAAANVGA